MQIYGLTEIQGAELVLLVLSTGIIMGAIMGLLVKVLRSFFQ